MFSWEKVTIIESPISIKDPSSNKCPTPLLARTLFHQIQYFELVQNSSATDKNWNPEAIAWNPESKTVLDSLTWGDTKHFQMRITYMISCFIGVYLSGFIFLVCWPRTF